MRNPELPVFVPEAVEDLKTVLDQLKAERDPPLTLRQLMAEEFHRACPSKGKRKVGPASLG